MAPERLDHRERGVGEHHGERVPLDAVQRPREPGDRSPAPRGGGVAGLVLDPDPQVEHPLLGDADHRRGSLQSGEHALDHGPALVDHQPRAYAPRGKRVDGRLGGRAEDLLVTAEGEVDVVGRRPPLGEQRLDRLADDDHGALVVERAATVHDTGGPVDPPFERRHLPGVRVGGHDVPVGHQHDRARGRRTAPAVQQTARAHDLALQLGVQSRIQPLEQPRQLGERLGVLLLAVRPRDGRQPDQRGEVLGRRVGPRGGAVGLDGVAHPGDPATAGRSRAGPSPTCGPARLRAVAAPSPGQPAGTEARTSST